VVIGNLHVVGVSLREAKDDTPLIVNGNRVLAFPRTGECVESIAWWHSQIIKTNSQINIFQPAKRSLNDLGRNPFRCPGPEKLTRKSLRDVVDYKVKGERLKEKGERRKAQRLKVKGERTKVKGQRRKTDEKNQVESLIKRRLVLIRPLSMEEISVASLIQVFPVSSSMYPMSNPMCT
jgi:hypothetical protein